MQTASRPEDRVSGTSCAGLSLIEVVYASAIALVASFVLYTTIMLAYSMICANQQRLEAEGLAMDKALEIFNTYDFAAISLATSLPPCVPPVATMLPSNSEIRVVIAPNTGTNAPYKWDVEVCVKRDRFWLGGKTVRLTNDLIYRVTRYDIGRN